MEIVISIGTIFREICFDASIITDTKFHLDKSFFKTSILYGKNTIVPIDLVLDLSQVNFFSYNYVR